MRNILVSALLVIAASGCSSGLTTDESTVFPYQISESASDRAAINKVVIATVNYGQDSPSYIRDHETRVDAEISRYMEDNGFSVLTGNQFDSIWSRNKDKFGEYFDPTQGVFRRERFNQILATTIEELKETHGVGAVVFTDLLVDKVVFDFRSPHYASWHGVKRKPRLKGGQGVSSTYNWAKSFRASSLSIVVFRTDKEFIFRGVGGIEMVDHMSVKSTTPTAVRSKTLFNDKSKLNEGMRLAFHPLIPMKNYPGDQ